ncbi:MAG: hypothetical protein VZS44_11305 [Bacilli bacterium]|nr:hypothetical protein [Bacilli bacterium]
MSSLFEGEATRRLANCCHLIYTNVPDKEIIENYGFSEEDINEAKKKMYKFDEFSYTRGGRAFKIFAKK